MFGKEGGGGVENVKKNCKKLPLYEYKIYKKKHNFNIWGRGVTFYLLVKQYFLRKSGIISSMDQGSGIRDQRSGIMHEGSGIRDQGTENRKL